MLKIVSGKAGTGKTYEMISLASQSAGQGRSTLLIVPEQFSFAAEREVLSQVKKGSAIHIKVLSFTRLAENIFRQYGGLADKHLTDVSAVVLMKLALNETKDSLSTYKSSAGKTHFIGTMLDMIGRFKQAGLSPKGIEELIHKTNDSRLKAKLSDFYTVYAAYQALLSRSFADPADDLVKACKSARTNNYFSGMTVFIDGFDYFSPPEREIIYAALEQADSVTVSLLSDGIGTAREGDIFTSQKKAAAYLIRYCRENSIPVASPLILSENRRASSPILQAVERISSGENTEDVLSDLMLSEPEKAVNGNSFNDIYPAVPSPLCICDAPAKYEEMAFVSTEILRLVREEKMRFRDMAVICHNTENYQSLIESLFVPQNIPVFFDRREQITQKPIITYINAALTAVNSSSFDTEVILRLARSPASGFTKEEAGILESYCYVWSVRGKDWLRTFKNNPAGLSDAPKESYAQKAAEVEALRFRIISPLQNLKKSLVKCDGKRFVIALYEYLTQTDAIKNLEAFFAGMGEYGSAQAQENEQLWDYIVDILDIFTDLLADSQLPVSEYVELFCSAVKYAQTGKIPNTNDCVIIGSAPRIRLSSPKVVFVVGANDGEFPAEISDASLFTKRERKELLSLGTEFETNASEKVCLEKLYLYTALSSCSERLYITSHNVSSDGSPTTPSKEFIQLKKAFPLSSFTYSSSLSAKHCESLFMAKKALAYVFAGDSPEKHLLEEMLTENGEAGFVEILRKSADNRYASGISPDTAQALLKGKIKLSPSSLETFYRCPYMFFCEKMLRVKPLERVSYTAQISGTALHFLLEKLLRDKGSRGLVRMTESEITEYIDAALSEFITLQSGEEGEGKERFSYQVSRLRNTAKAIIIHMAEDFAQSDFEAVGVELLVNDNGDITPLNLTAENGLPVSIIGRIDRVDSCRIDDFDYIRVVDYKSGSRDFKLYEVEYGLNMQMLIYLFAVCGDKNKPFGEARPAGILYSPARIVPMPCHKKRYKKTSVDDYIAKALCAKGLLLREEKVLTAMEQKLEGVFIPVSHSDIGENTAKKKPSKSLCSGEDFNNLKEKVSEKIKGMADALVSGELSPLPIRSSMLNPCDYCSYAMLCNNANGEHFREMKAMGSDCEQEGGDGDE